MVLKVAGKHGSRPWKELGWIRGAVVLLGSAFLGASRFFRTAPEWLVGLLLTIVAVVVVVIVLS